MSKAKKKAAKPKKIVSIDGGEVARDTDAEYIKKLVDSMSPIDRKMYNDYQDAIDICKETGKMTGYDGLIKSQKEICDKYEMSEDDSITICYDEVAMDEAS